MILKVKVKSNDFKPITEKSKSEMIIANQMSLPLCVFVRQFDAKYLGN